MVAAIGASSPVGQENDVVGLVPAWFLCHRCTGHIWISLGRCCCWRAAADIGIHVASVCRGGVRVPLSLCRSCGSGDDALKWTGPLHLVQLDLKRKKKKIPHRPCNKSLSAAGSSRVLLAGVNETP